MPSTGRSQLHFDFARETDPSHPVSKWKLHFLLCTFFLCYLLFIVCFFFLYPDHVMLIVSPCTGNWPSLARCKKILFFFFFPCRTHWGVKLSSGVRIGQVWATGISVTEFSFFKELILNNRIVVNDCAEDEFWRQSNFSMKLDITKHIGLQ